jgi:hypothetical protein
MAVTPELVDAMIATGLTREQIADLIKAELAAEAAKVEAKRAAQRVATAARVRKHREAQRNASNALQPLPSVTERYTEAAPNDPAPLPPHTPPITPTPNTHSDPVGSGSPSVEPTALAEPMDPRRELFGRGKQTVRKLTGRPMESCGSLIGRWLKVASDDAVVVLAVIDDAVAKELANPIPWIEATIKAEAQRNGSGPHDLFNGRASGGRPSGTVNASVSTAVARHAARLGIGPGGGQDHRGPRDPADHRPRRDDPAVEDADWTPARGHYAAH